METENQPRSKQRFDLTGILGIAIALVIFLIV
jgi:hypothetical protein